MTPAADRESSAVRIHRAQADPLKARNVVAQPERLTNAFSCSGRRLLLDQLDRRDRPPEVRAALDQPINAA
jgi:hypothetical protein